MADETTAPLPGPLGFVDKLRVVAAAIVAILLMRSVGWMVAEPADPEMAVVLTGSVGHILSVLPALLVLTVVSAIVGAVIAGPRLPEAGVFAAAVGLAALALQGGSMQAVLGYEVAADAASRRSLMMTMGFDCVLWSVLMVVAWLAVMAVCRWLWPDAGQTAPAGASDQAANESAKTGWSALAVTSVVALFVIWMTIARTPVASIARGQVIGSVAAGLYLGAMAARYFTGVSVSRWYAMAPAVVALVGFLLGYLQSNMSWAKGALASYALLATTPPHALARPLPIEYIAVGLAAVMVGYWSGEKIEHVAEQGMS